MTSIFQPASPFSPSPSLSDLDGRARDIFRRIVETYLATGERRADPSLDEQYRVILEHYEAMLEHYGTVTGVNMARKHIGWYTKGLTGSAEFRNAVNQQPDAATVKRMLADFYAPELHEPGGAAAKAALERLVRGQSLSCTAGKRSYDRVVAVCTLGGVALGDRLRSAGIREGGRGR